MPESQFTAIDNGGIDDSGGVLPDLRLFETDQLQRLELLGSGGGQLVLSGV